MKKRFLSLLSGVAVVALTSCGKSILPKGTFEEFQFKGAGYIDRDYFAIKTMMYSLSVGESKVIDATTLPSDYLAKNLSFESEDTSIVTVDEAGKISGVNKGITNVVIKDKDESKVGYVRVVVAEESTAKDCKSVIDPINDYYNDPGYTAPSRVYRTAYNREVYKCEGVVDHGMEDYEVFAYDKTSGYLMIEGPTLYYKTPYGTAELSEGKWVMKPVASRIKTRLFHITPTGKRYFEINTAGYSSKHEIMKDIMNFFFVSGEEIVSDLLDDYAGKADFSDLQGYSATKYYSVNSSSMYFTYLQTANREVSHDDELNYVDIPSGTPYKETLYLNYLNSGHVSSGYQINATMEYERGGKNWVREFVKNQIFEGDFEEEEIVDYDDKALKDAGFVYVDSIYDL